MFDWVLVLVRSVEVLGEGEGTQKEREALVDDEVIEMQQYIAKLFPPVC